MDFKHINRSYSLIVEEEKGLDKVAIDTGGYVTSILTLVFVILCLWIVGREKGKKEKEKEKFNSVFDYLFDYLKASGSITRSIITCSLLVTSVIAIWLTIRAGAVLVENLYVENYAYSQYQILGLISYILVVNLCFNLMKTLREKETKLSGIASASIQSVIIGVIVFLPQISSTGFLSSLQTYFQGVLGFLMISVSIAVILVSLTILWNRSENKTTNEELEKIKKDIEELKEREDRRVD